LRHTQPQNKGTLAGHGAPIRYTHGLGGPLGCSGYQQSQREHPHSVMNWEARCIVKWQ